MKTKASSFFKQMVSAIVAAVKAKSTAVRVKTSALKTRLLIFGILRNKKLLMAAINHKIDAIMGQQQQQEEEQQAGKDPLVDGDDGKKAIVLYTAPSFSFSAELGAHEVEAAAREQEDSDDYLTHSLFAEEDELVSAPGSVIDVMRDARDREREAAGGGAEFRLEEEIDHVADVFIRRIRRQLKLQKLDSFKRFCEMLERGA